MDQEGQQQLNNFWAKKFQDIEETIDFETHTLPLAWIKEIMEVDEEEYKISAEAPLVCAKACETFIQELTMRAWINAEENQRRTLQKSDIASAISKIEGFDFLSGVVFMDDKKIDH